MEATQCSSLTGRQIEALYWASRGLCKKEIATAMGLTKKTVEKHHTAALQRSGKRSVAGAVWHYRDLILSFEAQASSKTTKGITALTL